MSVTAPEGRRVEAAGAAPRGDAACVAFLQWALPQLQLRWAGFRKVRKLVCKRAVRRARELGLEGLDAYRARLDACHEEWATFDELCRIPISRFYRDRAVFDALRGELLPYLAARALARGERTLRVWSAGCASGEEPYTLSMTWRFDVARGFPSLGFHILATDADESMIERARQGAYGAGSLRLLPAAWRSLAFRDEGALCRIRDELREGIDFRREDLRTRMPDGPFDLVSCRNLVFTYFEPPLQRTITERMLGRVVDGGLLIVGCHERPPDLQSLAPYRGVRCAYVYRVPATCPIDDGTG
jgi:chemotaxis protein methyltransferase CheR